MSGILNPGARHFGCDLLSKPARQDLEVDDQHFKQCGIFCLLGDHAPHLTNQRILFESLVPSSDVNKAAGGGGITLVNGIVPFKGPGPARRYRH